MTAVVIAVSSRPPPRRMSAELKRIDWMAARIEAENAVSANRLILTRATGTPRLRAAAGDPPTPEIQLPNLRRARMYVPTAAMTIHQTIETCRSTVCPSQGNDSFQLKKPASGSAAIAAGSIGMYVMFVTTDVSTDDRPAMMNSVARVTMNDGSPVRTTMKPFTAPSAVAA